MLAPTAAAQGTTPVNAGPKGVGQQKKHWSCSKRDKRSEVVKRGQNPVAAR